MGRLDETAESTSPKENPMCITLKASQHPSRLGETSMTSSITATVAIGIVALWIVGCHKSSSTAPSPTPGATPSIVSLAIQGPSRIAPGETVQFTAVATLSDRTTRDYTRNLTWVAYPADVLTVTRETGEATGVGPGDAQVFADTAAGCSTSACHARTAIIVLPPNTYRLTGKVLEFGLGVQGASVTVLSGVGSGASAKTDYGGTYRLYGVAGAVQIKVSKAGYEDLVKSVNVTQNDVLDFPEAHQITAIPSMAGPYTLTLQADPGCDTTPWGPGNHAPLPPEFRQPRNYSAQLAQDGPSLAVTLAAPQFAAPTNQFLGRIKPEVIEFEFGNGYIGYAPDDGITEHISTTQLLTFEGLVTAQRVGSSVIGRLDGEIDAIEISNTGTPPFYRWIGSCLASRHQFAMRASTGVVGR